MYDSTPYFYGTGRRKKSVARVRVYAGTGKITINNRDIDDYFGLETLKLVVRQPLALTGLTDKFDIICTVAGGGVTGQAGAIRHGLSRALLHNMVVGVTDGFEKKLEVNGVGYRAAKAGKTLTLTLGYSHPVIMEDPEGIETVVDGQTIIVKGISKEQVGQFAAIIREKRKPEPYKGKGIKYADEVIRRKVGKTGKK